MDAEVRRSKSMITGFARFVLPQPHLLFLGDVAEPGFAKTAFGLRDWAGDRCVGEYALPGARVTLGLAKLDPRAAAARGARSMVIGVANAGGHIPPAWYGALLEASRRDSISSPACTCGCRVFQACSQRRTSTFVDSSMCARRRPAFQSRPV